MKISSSIIVLALACFCILPTANAQSPYLGGFNGGGVYEPGTFRAVAADVSSNLRWPGSIWVSANYADRGLGYRGSYLTAGMKTRLFEDFLDGRWLFEGRGHVSEEGGFFGNLGIERVFTVHAAGADVSVGAWFDYDDDTDSFAFANTLESVGVTGKIKTRFWDLIANGYFPIGTSDETQGDPTGASPFFEDRLVLVAGIDSGLRGFDVTVRTRPSKLAFMNGTFDFGGYGYDSDLVDFFGGGRVRMSFQMLRGMIVSGELNYDDRFDATGLLGVTLLYGANPRGHEYSPLGKDLERTIRNDHIVRYNRDLIVAIDPDTGAPYNVVHVDNTVGAGGLGTFESPFATLVEAEAASGTDDIIYVDRGDGTSTGLDGIELQEGQLLLGQGTEHPVPIANGPEFGDTFIIESDNGTRPQLTGMNNMAAVTLDSRNTVRGFDIDGADAVGGMSVGILGSLLETNIDGIIEDVMIRNAIVDGISITDLGGDWTFARNDIESSGFSGISLIDACDPTSIFNFDSNIVSNNILGNGIEIINYDAAEINFTNNVTDGNGMNGVLLEGFKGDDMIGTDILFDNHIARNNLGLGISVVDGSGNLTIMNSIIGTEILQTFVTTGAVLTGNDGGGINIQEFMTLGNNRILIADNEISGNGIGIGAGVNLEITEGIANVMLTGNQIDLNGIGVRAFADTSGVNPTTLNLDIVENESIGQLFLDVNQSIQGISLANTLQGIRAIADGQSALNLLVDQTSANDLPIFGSGLNGIDLLSDGESTIEAIIRNVDVASSGGSGIFGQVTEMGQLSILVEDSSIGRDLDHPIELFGLNGVPPNAFPNDGNGTGFTFAFDGEETGRINTIVIRNVIAADNGTMVDSELDPNFASGLVLTTSPGTFTDLAIIDSTFFNPWLGPFRTDGMFDGMNPAPDDGSGNGMAPPDRGFSNGIYIEVAGDADPILNPQIDNRTRLYFEGNTIDRYTFAGVRVETTGDAHVLAEFVGNTITNNGDGLDGGMQPDAPFFGGVEMFASGSSVINSRFTGNLIAGQIDPEVQINAMGTSEINALFIGNNMADIEGIAGIGSEISMAFSNNAIGAGFFANAGVFTLELDGFTNGITFANPFPAGIFEDNFGDTVEPRIEAEEAAFSIDGFPPAPPVFP